MIKVNIPNAQIATQRVINILERGEERLALAYLTDFKRKAYNKLYRAEKNTRRRCPRT